MGLLVGLFVGVVVGWVVGLAVAVGRGVIAVPVTVIDGLGEKVSLK